MGNKIKSDFSEQMLQIKPKYEKGVSNSVSPNSNAIKERNVDKFLSKNVNNNVNNALTVVGSTSNNINKANNNKKSNNLYADIDIDIDFES